jgi:hypothetical protein
MGVLPQVNHRTAPILIAALALTGCSRCQREQPVTPPSRAPSTAAQAAPSTPAASPPPERRALALPLITSQIPPEPAGTLDLEGADPTPVRAVSFARCRDGVALVPILEDAAGKLTRAEAFVLRLNDPPVDGKPHAYIDPLDVSNAATFAFTSLSPTRVQGTITATRANGLEPRTLTVDATPLPTIAAKGLGVPGCYTTGYFSLTSPHDAHGWATARFTAPNFFELNLPLDADHAITVLARIEPRSLTIGPFIEADLAKVFSDPEPSNVRVFFETRTSEQLGSAPEALPYSGWTRVPAESGTLRLGVNDASWRPVLSVDLTGVAAPAGYAGPLAGAKEISLRSAALFINPRQDHLATYPPPPPWWRKP